MTISTGRLYASAIAIVSGVYAIGRPALAAITDPMGPDLMAELGLGAWLMVGIGVVVLAHGIVLLTPAADVLGRRSGPLMLAWAAVMLADQWLIGMQAADTMMPRMEADAGMIAIAVLMAFSGLIMIARPMPRARDGTAGRPAT